MEIENEDIVICTVDKIVGTTVFVDVAGSEKKGTIILSEIAAGRIRNLRDYVVPKKIIICKVLRVMPDHLELSLRRVKEKDKKEALENYKNEKSYKKIIDSVLKEKSEKAIEEIEKESPLAEFLNEAKKDSKKLQKIVGKEDADKIIEILKKQKDKTFLIKKEIKITSVDPEGIVKIKEALKPKEGIEIKYLAAGKYLISAQGTNLKKADQKVSAFIDEIEKSSKDKNLEISAS